MFAAVATLVPPHVFFIVSAVFHYLGPACAVLLFTRIEPLGVAWLRIATAALFFAVWRRPWRALHTWSRDERALVVAMGAVLAIMNGVFYLAIARLPLATVGAIEFFGPICIAAVGSRSARNIAALAMAGAGVYALTDARLASDAIGYIYAFANCGLFMLYVIIGHRIARSGDAGGGIDRLAAAMGVAMVIALPFGIADARPAFGDATLLFAAIGVGIASSVVPYVCDQLAMARLPRATFALLLSLLPATAAIIGLIVLHQRPRALEIVGIALVIAGVALHRSDRID